MAVYYYKELPILAPFVITSNEPHFDVTTLSLKTQRVSQGHQRWELSFDVQAEMNDPDRLLVDMLTEDQSLPDTMVMPQFKNVVETTTASGSVTVNSTTAVGATTVSLNSSAASGILKKGSFVKFSNHSKVYIVTEDSNFLISTASLSLYPSLKASVPSSTTSLLYGDSCSFSYYRDIATMTNIQFTDGILSNPGRINLFEAV